GLGGIRIDSGELVQLAPFARELLDSLGARETRIVLTGGLDEYAMEELGRGPVDAFGAGEKLINHPNPGFVYKLVAIAEGGAPGRLAPAQLSIQAGPPALVARIWSPQPTRREVARR